ncbi:hypothetical protein Cch01nite_05710 [Cellulomonas chitinilytica]|uniref:Uncharacterized protein n=1 Tax=Cellulomonas chitinilytica TaxID=398759 RepID=A0A919P0F7_9CELL|nr:hypothetical protein Cch01nite_05710 [Cellulomonas chitinilytica]
MRESIGAVRSRADDDVRAGAGSVAGAAVTGAAAALSASGGVVGMG